MLPALANDPQTDAEWSRWAWDHRDSHDRIRAAIKRKLGKDLRDYQVEPMTIASLDLFLQNNSQMHDDMNTALGLQSSDLEDANFGDSKERSKWIKDHYLEHQYAEEKAGA